jgi:protease-4
MIRPNLKGLYDKLGITKDRAGFYPGREIFSEYGKLGIDSKKFLLKEIERVKNRFYEVVTKSRNISIKELQPKAGGRIFSGKDFLNMKMVDSNKTLINLLYDLKAELKLSDLEWEYLIPVYSFKTMVKDFRMGIQFARNPIKYMFQKQEREILLFKSEFTNFDES